MRHSGIIDVQLETCGVHEEYRRHRISQPERAMAYIHKLERAQLLERPIAEVFPFFADASNLEAITPEFLRFRVLSPLPITMQVNARIDYQLSLFGLPLSWRTRITQWEPGLLFVDEQESGPYSLWRHTHRFEARGSATLMRDTVEYAEPFGPLGALAHVLFVERTLARIFDFRRDKIARMLGAARGPHTRLD